MIRWLVLAIALVGCGKSADKSAPPTPVGSAQPIPESTTIDWKNLDYDLGSLGTVKATGGRAEFRVVEDDDGTVHATQHADATSAWTGFLDLDDPAYVVLNGDGHDETGSRRADESALVARDAVTDTIDLDEQVEAL